MGTKAVLRRLAGRRSVELVRRLRGNVHLDEIQLVHRVLSRQRRTGVMFDVGAHHGFELGMFVETGWRVIAFEPDAANRAILTEKFGNNERVKIDCRAVSDKPETNLPFFASDVSTGISSLLAFHESHAISQTVDTTTVGLALEQYGIDHVDFLKIDIEGYDLFAIKGVDWAKDRPDVIVCEYENGKTEALGYTVEDSYAYLVDRGYRVTISEWLPIVQYGAQHRWKKFCSETAELDPKGWGNLIAYRPREDFAGLTPQALSWDARRLYGSSVVSA